MHKLQSLDEGTAHMTVPDKAIKTPPPPPRSQIRQRHQWSLALEAVAANHRRYRKYPDTFRSVRLPVQFFLLLLFQFQ
ncbi:hypothetical protein BK654_00600 [Pseudomonas brassicacearum]|nr:hypothetical protein BK654_00600 [Pseudomonas brassicacearum]